MPFQICCKAFLFDMDGTLVDSTNSVEAIWREWASRHAIDVDHLLAVSHGRRTLDTLREIAPHLDIEAEARLLEDQEIQWKDGVAEVPGARSFLASLPTETWSVVTSASRPLAEARLRMAGLPIPRVLICASDVDNGKPDPEGYILAAEAMGVSSKECLVFEDTPAGINAARAAGAQVVAVTTTYPVELLIGAQCISDFTKLQVFSENGSLCLHV